MLITDLSGTHVEDVCTLFSTVFGVGMSPEVWRWKYQGAAQIGSINLAAYDEKYGLVGHAGAIVLPGSFARGRAIAVAQVCDIMVAPLARGGLGRSEVYPKLMQAMKDSLASRYPGVYAYGFPGERPFRLGERLGFYWRIEGIAEFRLPAQRKSLSLWAVDSLDWGSRHIDRVAHRTALMRETPGVIRNEVYLGWRYRQCPDRGYTLLRLRRAFRSVGWVVVSGEGDVLRVVDGVFPGYDASSVTIALADWALHHRFRELVTWFKVPGADARETGIVATEFGVHPPMGRHLPDFQPGDVDIF